MAKPSKAASSQVRARWGTGAHVAVATKAPMLLTQAATARAERCSCELKLAMTRSSCCALRAAACTAKSQIHRLLKLLRSALSLSTCPGH